MKKTNILNFAVMIFLFSAHLDVWGQTPPGLMNFQGRLTDAANNPLTGPQNFTFRIYDAPAGGTQLWTETQAGITVTNGVLSVQLGAGVPLTADIFNGGAAYLEITVGGVTLSPRQRLVTSAYAFNAHRLEGRSYAAFVTTDAAAGYADGPAVGAATATLRTDLNAVALSTGPLVSYANWNTAFGWGNHALAGYTDGSAIGVATATLRTDLNAVALSTGPLVNYANWDTAYGWGNHGAAGYAQGSDLTTEMNNRISADNTIGMATGTLRGDLNAVALSTGPLVNYANWDTAYGWGNHALAGYTDGSAIGAATATLRTDLNAVALSTGPLVSYANWNTAFGWGNHASAGYTSGSAVGAATATLRTDLNTLALSTGPLASYANWNTAYGWGNHASAGYVALDSSQTFTAQNAFQNQVTISSNLFVMTGNVGIGTTEPGSRLEVAGGSSTFRGSDANSAIAGFTDAGGNYRVVISTAGNVGIGTASPEHLLDVRGNIHSNSELTVEAAIANIIATSPGVTAFYHTNDASGALLKVDGNWPIRFNTNSNERMRIDGSGSVGIGTTGPGTKLDVAGNAQFGQGVLKSTFTAVPGGSDYALYLSSGLYLASGGIRWADNTVSTTAGAGGGLGGAALLAATQTFTGGGTFTSTAAFTAQNASAPGVTISSGLIVSAGNVGIGTLNPGSKLEVTGFVTAGTGVGGEGSAQMGTWAPATTYAFWGNGALNQTISTNYALRQHTGGTTVVNAGAGTTLYLGVGDNTYMYFQGSDAVISNKNLTVSNGSIVTTGGGIMEAGPGSAAAPAYRFAGFTNTGLFALTGPVLGFTTGGVEQMRIESSGNVGIGTISPTSKLEVDGVLTVSGTPARIIIDGGSESVINFMGSGSVFDGQINTKPDKSMWFYAGGDSSAPKMAIANTGNFGVGTATPDAILHISSISASAAQDMLKVTTGTANADVFVVKGSGNVGIGTTNPANGRLSIQTLSTTQNPVWIQNPSAQSRFAVELLNDYLNLYMYNNTGAQGVVLRTDGNNSFIKTGNVGIGTAGPGAKLDVEGSAQFGQGVMKSTFTAVPGGSEYALYLSSGLYLASGGIRWADNTVSTTAVAGGGLGGAELLVATQTFTGANTFTSTAAFTAQNASAPGVTISSGLIVSAGNVGIGTASPGSKLSVSGGDITVTGAPGNFPRMYFDGNGTNVAVVFNRVRTGETIYFGESGDTGGYQLRGTGDINLGSDRMVISNGGSVGVGTTAPGSKFEVVGGSSTFRGSDSNSAIAGFTDAGGNYRMVVSTAGNVGIGTTGPSGFAASGNLDVLGDIKSRSGQYLTGDAGDEFVMVDTDGNAAWMEVKSLRVSGSVYERAEPGSGNLIVDGNVGIGTPGPGAKLDVAGNAQFGSGAAKSTFTATGGLDMASGSSITLAGGGRLTGVPSPSADSDAANKAYVDNLTGSGSPVAVLAATQTFTGQNAFQNQVAISSDLVVMNGSVGIGTTAPAHKLDVAGNINAAAGSAYLYNGVNVIIASTTLNNYFFGGAGNFTMTGSNNTATGLGALVSNTAGYQNVAVGVSALTLNTTGRYNTGVGVDALHLNTAGHLNVAVGAAALYDLAITDGTGSNTVIGAGTGRGIVTGVNNTIIGANVTGLPAALSNTIIIADGAGNRRINVDDTGNVGIGTTDPLGKLDIYAPDNSAGSGAGLKFTLADGKAGVLLEVSSPTSPATTGAILWTDNIFGRLKIGSPGGVNNQILSFEIGGAATTNNEFYGYDRNAGRRFIQYLTDSGDLALQPASGNVGIGTTGPGAKLEVQGTTNDGNSLVTLAQSGTGRGLYVTRNVPSATRVLANFAQLSAAAGIDPVLHVQQAAATEKALAVSTDGSIYNFSVTGVGNMYAAGDVGIGTTPEANVELHIKQSAVNGNADLYLENDAQKWGITTRGDVSDSLVINDVTGSSPKVTIQTDGDVGIGTTSPTLGKLQVDGGASAVKLAIKTTNPGASVATLRLENSAGAFNDVSEITHGGGVTEFRNGTPTTVMALEMTNARVGIGLTNPGYKLDVAGTMNAQEVRVNGVVLSPGTGSNWTVSGPDVYRNGGKVGIGTTAPGEKLDVSGGNIKVTGLSAAQSSIYLNKPAASDAQALTFQTGGTDKWNLGVRANNSYLEFWDSPAGTSMLTIAASGSVGIGTAGPGAKLDVRGTDTQAYSLAVGTSTAYSLVVSTNGKVGIGVAEPGANLHVGADTAGRSMIKSGATFENSYLLLSRTGDDATIVNKNDGTLRINHSGSSTDAHLVILNTGNVGIGTANPASSFEVQGTGITLGGVTRTTWPSGSGTGFGTDAGTYAYYTGGNVGIGTAAPEAKLHVYSAASAEHLFETGGGQNFLTVKSPGTTTLNSALRLRSGAKTTELAISAPDNGTGQAGDLYVWDADDGAVRLIVKDGGNVGIGTTGPGSLLHVSGSGARISVQTTDNGVLPGYQWKNAVGSTIGTFTQSGGTGNFSLDTAAGGIGNIMTMLYSSGNVGIGTADPQARLDVGSAGGDISLGYNYTGTNILRKSFTTAHAAGNVPAALAIGTDDGAWAGITINSLRDGAFNSQSIAFDTHHGGVSVGTRMTIDKDGNVGIGTAAPQGLLHVSGSLARIYVQKPDASANRGLWRFNADTDGVFSLQAINDAFSSAYNAFTITRDGTNGIASVAFPNGNVGIGVTDPKVVLQAGSAANRIGAEPRTDGMAIGGVAASNSARVGGFYNANPIPGAAIHFGAQGAGGQRGAIAFLTKALDDDATQPSAQMVITNGGDVGIGTTNPSAKLEVAGDIKANNFQNSWTAYAPTTSLGHTGCTGRYIVQGKIVYVQLYVPGQALTTGAASWSMSLPLTSASNLPTELSRTVFINASSTRQTGVLIINTSASSVDVYAAPSLPPWSSAGTGSGIAGTLISYPID